jgi:hypothetical protein
METVNETNPIELIYSYKNNKGGTLFTPNAKLAEARAYYYGTDDVYGHNVDSLLSENN